MYGKETDPNTRWQIWHNKEKEKNVYLIIILWQLFEKVYVFSQYKH